MNFKGANPASFFTNNKVDVCDICKEEKDIDNLVIIHNNEVDMETNHLFICKECNMPENYWACGCGG